MWIDVSRAGSMEDVAYDDHLISHISAKRRGYCSTRWLIMFAFITSLLVAHRNFVPPGSYHVILGGES